MVKTVAERHAEARLHPTTLPPCESEAECRTVAKSGKPEALIALAQALIDNSIEHQDPEEALISLDKARKAAGRDDKGMLELISDIERRARKKQHELNEALQLEIMHNEDA